MQELKCAACVSPVPLNHPRLVGGQWQAVCGECLAINRLVSVSQGVFLPMRFRVLHAAGDCRAAALLIRAASTGG